VLVTLGEVEGEPVARWEGEMVLVPQGLPESDCVSVCDSVDCGEEESEADEEAESLG